MARVLDREKIEVYSMPMTPAPTTASVRGSCFSFTTSSVFRMTSPSAQTGRVGRVGADRDQDVLGRGLPPAAVRADHQRVGINERGLAGQKGHVIAAELVLDHLGLAGDHDVDAGRRALAGGPRVELGPRQRPVALARQAGEGDAPASRRVLLGMCRCRCRRRPRRAASRRWRRDGPAWPPERRRAGPRGRCRCRPDRSRRNRS